MQKCRSLRQLQQGPGRSRRISSLSARWVQSSAGVPAVRRRYTTSSEHCLRAAWAYFPGQGSRSGVQGAGRATVDFRAPAGPRMAVDWQGQRCVGNRSAFARGAAAPLPQTCSGTTVATTTRSGIRRTGEGSLVMEPDGGGQHWAVNRDGLGSEQKLGRRQTSDI